MASDGRQAKARETEMSKDAEARILTEVKEAYQGYDTAKKSLVDARNAYDAAVLATEVALDIEEDQGARFRKARMTLGKACLNLRNLYSSRSTDKKVSVGSFQKALTELGVPYNTAVDLINDYEVEQGADNKGACPRGAM
jgi:hypothetical protein